MSEDYTYETYLEGDEVKNPMVAETPPETNEYTGDEYAGHEYTDMFSKADGEDLNAVSDEQLDTVLDNFKEDNWSDLSLEEQKHSITDLADCVATDTENKNPPEIVFCNDMADGTYGGYNPETNMIEINENMLGNSEEAADTIAHEMWHAHQHQCAEDPTSEKGQEYQEGFDNYISPEYDFEGYENQMVEAEAREYAQGFKDKLKGAA